MSKRDHPLDVLGDFLDEDELQAIKDHIDGRRSSSPRGGQSAAPDPDRRQVAGLEDQLLNAIQDGDVAQRDAIAGQLRQSAAPPDPDAPGVA